MHKNCFAFPCLGSQRLGVVCLWQQVKQQSEETSNNFGIGTGKSHTQTTYVKNIKVQENIKHKYKVIIVSDLDWFQWRQWRMFACWSFCRFVHGWQLSWLIVYSSFNLLPLPSTVIHMPAKNSEASETHLRKIDGELQRNNLVIQNIRLCIRIYSSYLNL